MIGGIHGEVLLVLGYAAFLGVVAALLEAVARYTHKHSADLETAGFRYHRSRDAWECPRGTPLHRSTVDADGRVVVYRASPAVCNACPAKSQCTDSDEGRSIVRDGDSWLQSEVRRFHRGLSLVLLVLAVFILTVESVRAASERERLTLGIALLVTIGSGTKSAVEWFRRSSRSSRLPDEVQMR